MDTRIVTTQIVDVDFMTSGNSSLFTCKGLSTPEVQGTRTIGESSVVELPVGYPTGRVSIRLIVLPCMPPGDDAIQTLTILAGDACLGVFSTRNNEEWLTLILTIPQHVLCPHGILRLTLLHPTTVTLAQAGVAGDVRALAFLLQRLTVFAEIEEGEALSLVPSPPVAALPMPPVLAGEAILTFEPCHIPGRFGRGWQHEKLQLYPTMEPLPQLPFKTLAEMPQLLIDEHFQYPPPPDVNIYAVHDGMIWDRGVVTSGTSFVMNADIFPSYFRSQVQDDGHSLPIEILKPERWATSSYLRCERPVACFLHPNLVYGHFLLEMLPKLYVLSELKSLGCDFVVAMPTGLSQWVKSFVEIYFHEDNLMYYNPEEQIIQAPSIILPSMMQTSHNFHPCFNLLVDDIHRRISTAATPHIAGPKRLFLSRSRVSDNRRLLNESVIEQEAEALGLSLVHPQELSIREQIALFGQAELIVGEYSSALHNTLFSRFGARVVSMDMPSWYQSAIGRLRQQPIAFVAPRDGRFRHWRTPAGQNRTYEIDPAELRDAVAAMSMC